MNKQTHQTLRTGALALAIAATGSIAVGTVPNVFAQSSYLSATRTAPDWRLEAEAGNQLARRASLAGSNIEVTVHDGIAKLEGTALSDQQLRLAEEVVGRTRGVRRVDNELKVDADGAGRMEREIVDDDELASRLAKAAAAELPGAQVDDDLFFGYEVEGDNWQFEINADAGDVTVEGTVPEPSDVSRIVGVLRQDPAVRRVDAELEVDARRGYAGDTGRGAVIDGANASMERDRRWADDRWTADRLFSDLAANANLLGTRIESTISEGVASLSGVVANAKQKIRAERIARRAEGVREVNNEIMVDEALDLERETVEDEVLAKRLAEALVQHFPGARLDEAWFGGWEVEGSNWELEIDVDDGEVNLDGSVPEPADLRKVLETVRDDRGVRAIESSVEAERHNAELPERAS